MKVKELIELLKQVDGELLVVMSKDSEGNDFSPLSDGSERFYEAETTWYGRIGLKELTPEDIKDGYGEEDVLENGIPALVLWPVN